jgi:hypothetical protein
MPAPKKEDPEWLLKSKQKNSKSLHFDAESADGDHANVSEPNEENSLEKSRGDGKPDELKKENHMSMNGKAKTSLIVDEKAADSREQEGRKRSYRYTEAIG